MRVDAGRPLDTVDPDHAQIAVRVDVVLEGGRRPADAVEPGQVGRGDQAGLGEFRTPGTGALVHHRAGPGFGEAAGFVRVGGDQGLRDGEAGPARDLELDQFAARGALGARVVDPQRGQRPEQALEEAVAFGLPVFVVGAAGARRHLGAARAAPPHGAHLVEAGQLSQVAADAGPVQPETATRPGEVAHVQAQWGQPMVAEQGRGHRVGVQIVGLGDDQHRAGRSSGHGGA
ncbi:hypothetical protein [Nocardia sp. alder85J]|uniref:hypothetical protein n=1 Tax=Nocardia sp. alder85J TaxID=2862949 RepID=UPI001CD61118|nr:hypothetical protein [Nocardia sp. alder85J]MCX4091452.1 hypothetical protein [Nocardia sp. alder85J]